MTGSDLSPILEECFHIETRGWKGISGSPISRHPRVYRFYTGFAQRMSRLGQFALYVLKVDGKVIAFKYCVRSGGRLDSLKTSFDPAWASYAPGFATLLLVARREIEEGTSRTIHLGAPSAHKLRWATGVLPVGTLDVYSGGLRARVARAGPFVREAVESVRPMRSVVDWVQHALNGARAKMDRTRVLVGKRLSR